MLHGFIKGIACLAVRLLSVTRVFGKENLHQDSNTIFICNHQNIPDAVFMYHFLPSNTHFMAKEEYWESGFMRFFLPRLHAFPVNRRKTDLSSLRYASGLLKDGKNLCIYPQGTRCNHPEVKREEMHGGVAMLALREHSKIVPMVFTAPPRLFHKNCLYVGEPICYDDLIQLNSRNINALTDRMTDVMNALFPGEKS